MAALIPWQLAFVLATPAQLAAVGLAAVGWLHLAAVKGW